MVSLPTLPDEDDTDAVTAWVATHLGHLTLEGADGIRPGGHRGGQQAADTALATLDITGYARSRSTVLPEGRRGATRMSPYIRHGLLSLRGVWDAVEDAPSSDRRRYRDELLWQEYARHLYARERSGLAEPLRFDPPHPSPTEWSDQMACTSWLRQGLEDDGWLVNQTRMWWSSHWTVRHGRSWREGEDDFFRHLLDGSRAANRLGWQWTVGTATGKPYGFSRWQVEKRAPQLCRSCPLRDHCPIQSWPDASRGPRTGDDLLSAAGGTQGPGAGPTEPTAHGEPAAAWLTAESLGESDPALAAYPDLPVVFVFDEPLLRRLRLSGKRLVFLTECLADLATRRDVDVRLGRVPDELAGMPLAVTFAPVPGFVRHAARVDVAQLFPWPWLVRPTDQRLTSYSAWRRGATVSRA